MQRASLLIICQSQMFTLIVVKFYPVWHNYKGSVAVLIISYDDSAPHRPHNRPLQF